MADEIHSGTKNINGMEVVVTYDEDYYAACLGNIKIYVDGTLLYDANEMDNSGSVWFDDDWNEHVENGELTWSEEGQKDFMKDTLRAFSRSEFKQIVRLVNDVLSEVSVCCGGCV